jgi:tocopherol cyclase
MQKKYLHLIIVCSMALGACSNQELEKPWPTNLPDNPEDGYHYDDSSDPYYEGWYHKVALPSQDDAFFFIYTVANPLPGSQMPAEAFLYCGRQKTGETVYQSFPVDSFSASRKRRDVRIGDTARATALRFAGEAEDAGVSCEWDIWLEDGVAWTETMGWLTGQTGLETSWTVGTIRAHASGRINFNGQSYEFDDGVGYCDHNWGIIFPRSWIWMQAASFPDSDAALAASGGTVDLGETEIEAMMIGLYLDGEMNTFRTQDFDTVERQAEKGHWLLNGESGNKRINIEANCDPEEMFHLLAPTETGMQPRAWESLMGTVSVTLEQRASETDDWLVVFEKSSDYAGVEIGE